MRVLAVTLLVLACGREAHADDIAQLGDIAGKRARITVRGELSKQNARELLGLVEDVVDDVERRFSAAVKTPDPEVTLLLFSDAARYRAVARTLREPLISDWGFYLPDRRTAIANVGASIGNLRHELVHPLLGDDYPTIPAWLNEGIASLYGSAQRTKAGFKFLVNYRLRDLQRALESGTVPSLAELAASTAADVHGERAMVYYAVSRYLLLYLDTQGTLGTVYAELRASKVGDHGAILAKHVDEAKFHAWAKRLRYGRASAKR